MTRWHQSDSYGLFAGLVKQAPDETRHRTALILRRARLASTIAESRRRDRLAARRVASLCWGVVTAVAIIVLLLASACVDSPRDHVGPDELAHVRAGRQVVEVSQ